MRALCANTLDRWLMVLQAVKVAGSCNKRDSCKFNEEQCQTYPWLKLIYYSQNQPTYLYLPTYLSPMRLVDIVGRGFFTADATASGIVIGWATVGGSGWVKFLELDDFLPPLFPERRPRGFPCIWNISMAITVIVNHNNDHRVYLSATTTHQYPLSSH